MPFWKRHHPAVPSVDEMSAKAPLRRHESKLYGSTKAMRGKQYGYGWFNRTFGLAAIRIECTADTGLQSIAVWARPCGDSRYISDIFVATKTTHWLRLMDGEYVADIDVDVAKNRVSSVRFKTNLRQSQWFRSTAKTVVHHLAPPPGFIIHMIQAQPTGVTLVGNSAPIGSKACDATSREWFQFSRGAVGAIVVSVNLRPMRIELLNRTDYLLHLAHLEEPLKDGVCLLVLAEHEFLTGIRTWVRDQSISSVQFVTNRRETEWFGMVPPADATVEARRVEDEPQATHIGGVFGMKGDGGIKSIGLTFYRRAE